MKKPNHDDKTKRPQNYALSYDGKHERSNALSQFDLLGYRLAGFCQFIVLGR